MIERVGGMGKDTMARKRMVEFCLVLVSRSLGERCGSKGPDQRNVVNA